MVKCCVLFAIRTELLNNSSARSATTGSHRVDLGDRGDQGNRGDMRDRDELGNLVTVAT
jgi:hypothetical protein